MPRMLRRVALAGTIVAVFGSAIATPSRASAVDDPAAIAVRMRTHEETAGLRETSKPIVGPDAVTCLAGGSLGRIQALFLDLAESERGLEVRSVELQRAPDTLLAKGVTLLVEYTVAPVAQPDDRTAKNRWAVAVILGALTGGSIAGQGLTVMSGKLADGTFTVDGRALTAEGSKSVSRQLDPAPTHLVKSVDVEQKQQRQMVQDPSGDTPQRAVTFYAFRLVARYDASSVDLAALKRAAYP